MGHLEADGLYDGPGDVLLGGVGGEAAERAPGVSPPPRREQAGEGGYEVDTVCPLHLGGQLESFFVVLDKAEVIPQPAQRQTGHSNL